MNTATESSQTNRLLRVFHSCYFHYSEKPATYFQFRCELSELPVSLSNALIKVDEKFQFSNPIDSFILYKFFAHLH